MSDGEDWRRRLHGFKKDMLAYLDTAVKAATESGQELEYAGNELTEDKLDEAEVDELANSALNTLEEKSKTGHLEPMAYGTVLGARSEEVRICRCQMRRLRSGHKSWLLEALSNMYERKKRMENK